MRVLMRRQSAHTKDEPVADALLVLKRDSFHPDLGLS